MKYFELDKNEKEIVKDFKEEKLKRISDLKREKSRYKEYARGSLGKVKNINIRISKRDLQKLRVKAAEKGIPYQTLVSSVLHQYSEEKLKEIFK